MDKISLLIISIAIGGIIYPLIYYWPLQPQETEVDPLSTFTVCHPVEDLNKSTVTFDGSITWTKDYCLKWDDFQGIPDPKNDKTAFTAWRVKTLSDYEILRSNGSQFRFTKIDVVAFFDKTKSWVKKDVLDLYDIELLRHEQGHFDCAEEHARKIENITKTRLMDKIFPIPLVSGNLKIDARTEADRLAREVFDELFNLQTLSDIYDNYTVYGTKFREQQEYNLRFDKLRNS